MQGLLEQVYKADVANFWLRWQRVWKPVQLLASWFDAVQLAWFATTTLLAKR
jgi:hypothetical protein